MPLKADIPLKGLGEIPPFGLFILLRGLLKEVPLKTSELDFPLKKLLFKGLRQAPTASGRLKI